MQDEAPTLEHHAFILDAKMMHPLDVVQGERMVKQMIKELLERLCMKELAALAIFPATDLEFPGFSFIQPITTSHIAGHYFESIADEAPHIHLDIYSCKIFDWREALSLLDSFLTLAEWDANYVVRHHGQERLCYQLSGMGSTPESIRLLTPQKVEGSTIKKKKLLTA